MRRIKEREGELVRALLAVRGSKDPDADETRMKANAYLWAEEQRQKLVEALARETYFHEDLFPLLDQLPQEQLTRSEQMHIEALGRVLCAQIGKAVTVRPLHAEEKHWWAVFLDLVKLKEILRPPHT